MGGFRGGAEENPAPFSSLIFSINLGNFQLKCKVSTAAKYLGHRFPNYFYPPLPMSAPNHLSNPTLSYYNPASTILS